MSFLILTMILILGSKLEVFTGEQCISVIIAGLILLIIDALRDK